MYLHPSQEHRIHNPQVTGTGSGTNLVSQVEVTNRKRINLIGGVQLLVSELTCTTDLHHIDLVEK